MTARPRPRLAAPVPAPRHRLSDALRPSNGPPRQRWFGRPLQAAAAEQVANNSLQHISYRMGFSRVNQRIYRVKLATRGGGGSTAPGDDDDDALAPSDFFAPTGPLRACASPSPCYIPLRRPRHLPAVRSGWPSPLHRRKCSGLSLSPPCTLHWCGVPSLVL